MSHKIHKLFTPSYEGENNYTAIKVLCNIFIVDTGVIYAKISPMHPICRRQIPEGFLLDPSLILFGSRALKLKSKAIK